MINKVIKKYTPHFRRWMDKSFLFLKWLCILSLLWPLLQITTFAHFIVPTGSMLPTLLPGDRILVNKWIMGGRIFNLQKAIEGKEVKIFRLPGFGKVDRNDVLVFNYPYHHAPDSISMDIMSYYVKRCVALPGDTFEIKGGHNRVYGIKKGKLGSLYGQNQLGEIARMRGAGCLKIHGRCFPNDSILNWSIADFGPIFLPCKGSEVVMNRQNATIYRHAIEWEQKQRLLIQGDSVCLGDSLIDRYMFSKNYYFVMGDNVLDSQDSRFWGLLPEEYIVGKATRIWKSIDKATGRVRQERMLKKIL